jgi:hypothetical protein
MMIGFADANAEMTRELTLWNIGPFLKDAED